ncbi:aldolase/citrate lyase family protein [Chenggangzhangella methanolivorans]|uniref:HpcH/HpaI aldolase/citrate lyase domain-containing protein n=1 Tax=Chenggangzhangella methanolivorans TaxID=1437009 RepID=A0A9E6RG32_9HYPH|nr:aldolase/citrate lyase family protein [Chenggangzhangella methanolivorans]QZO00741.1 hypothetical protein K6K41_03380 [Chenggangzhangella methanolivorans]
MRRFHAGPIRSVLVASPGDPISGGADALLFDLGQAGAAGLEAVARRLRARPGADGPLVVLKLAPLDDGGAEQLAALGPLRPDAVATTAAETGADLQHLGALLSVAEAAGGLDDGEISIVAVAETTASLFGLIGFAVATPRLAAIAWDGEALGADFGDEEPRDADGRWSDPLQTARTLALAAAADAGLPALDSPFSTRDSGAFRGEAERARRDGFSGKISLDVNQAAIAQETFAAR